MDNSVYDLVGEEAACTDCGSTYLELVVIEGERTQYICMECGHSFWLPEED